jgi:predicted transcriptional regulator of viral defense system
MVDSSARADERAIELFRGHPAGLRTTQALRLGVHPRTLYGLRDQGVLEQVDRGLYRLADLPALAEPDLVTVALKVPRAVICLISALAFHELTTQIPHEVYVALERGSERPRLTHPPLRVFWFSGPSFHAGVEEHQIDGVPVCIYGPEKTVADCFKFRNKVGLDIAIEALRLWRDRPRPRPDVLLHYARIDRVERTQSFGIVRDRQQLSWKIRSR